MPAINGKTALYGLFGFPVEHTASPLMHNAAFEELGLNAAYLPFPVSPDRLGDAVKSLRALGIRGVNVTIPHKQTVIPFLDDLSTAARTIGAVNTIEITPSALIGHNTDSIGFIRALKEEAGFSVEGKPVFIAGCGGAGFAIAVQCALCGASSLTVMDADRQRAHALKNKIATVSSTKVSVADTSDLVPACVALAVNATPLGMHETDPLPFSIDELSDSAIVYDIVYNVPQTTLLKTARDRNIKAYGGLSMLLYQGVEAFEIWTGKTPPVKTMNAVLQRAVYGVQK
ncbi:MAG: shikimate dehydrogenase [Candidatus Auribacterota bacterium]